MVLDIMSTKKEEGERTKEDKNVTAAPWLHSHLNQIPLSPFYFLLSPDLESKLLTIAGVGANAMGLYQTGSAPRELALGCTV